MYVTEQGFLAWDNVAWPTQRETGLGSKLVSSSK